MSENKDALHMNCCDIDQEIKINIRDDEMWEAILTECGCRHDLGKMEMGKFENGKVDMTFVGADEIVN